MTFKLTPLVATLASALALTALSASAVTILIGNQGDALSMYPHSLNESLQLTVVENVQMALLSHDDLLLSMWRRAADHRRGDALALLDQVGMKSQADRPCNVLAYGDVKRVELAVAMANSPKLLLMDEPTAGMAPKERKDLMALTKELVVQRGMAVLFTEHSMDVVFAYADRMIVLARGRLIAEGKPLEIRDHPKVQEVYFGTGKTFEKSST